MKATKTFTEWKNVSALIKYVNTKTHRHDFWIFLFHAHLQQHGMFSWAKYLHTVVRRASDLNDRLVCCEVETQLREWARNLGDYKTAKKRNEKKHTAKRKP